MKPLFISAVVTFLLDQASKYFVVQFLDLKSHGALDVIDPFLNLRMAWNRGINFGLFSNNADAMRWVLIAVALVVSVWVVLWVYKSKMSVVAQVSAGLLVGGALGNVLDRLIYGAVADFLNMSCCGIENPYAFNIADIGVFAGAFGLLLFSGGSKTA